MTGRKAALRIASVFGAIVAYGYLIACLALVGFQGYRWFQNGEWTHVGVNAPGLHRGAGGILGRTMTRLPVGDGTHAGVRVGGGPIGRGRRTGTTRPARCSNFVSIHFLFAS